MTRDVYPSSESPAELVVSPGDEVDPELLALPDPPKRGRTLTVLVLALTALASLAMVFTLRRDIAYAFTESHPVDMGDLRLTGAEELAKVENRHIEASGMLGAAGAILYQRPFSDDTFRAMPLAGRSDVWIEVRVPVGKENSRWEAPHTFSGRLIRFEATGPRHRGLSEAIAQATARPVPEGSWLVVDGEAPSRSRWSLALALLFFGFAAWNVATIARLLRRVS